jgi:predicted SAM-dependent methyltransferase
LHRYFVQRHGWHIDGLDRSASDFSEQDSISRQQVPAFLMDVFSEAFGQTGLMLHELAIFAATLEHMIHNEATERLKDVYKVLDYSTHNQLEVQQVQVAMAAYLVSLMQGQEVLATREALDKATRKIVRTYPGWHDAQVWLDDVRQTISYLHEGMVNPFIVNEGSSFTQVERSVQQVSERLGQYQDTECRDLKDQLLEHEEWPDSGRVLLSEFYKRGMETGMQFVEKPEFLRQLGVLDETKPGEPRVIIPNYMLSQSNCLADMGFYSICCINECEALLAHLERKIGAPEASPAWIAAIVSNLSSSTVEAPRALPQNMIHRLEEVANRHAGTVPLHGRLFAQWLHFLFPRECPYPHAAGTHAPLTPAEWQETMSESVIM